MQRTEVKYYCDICETEIFRNVNAQNHVDGPIIKTVSGRNFDREYKEFCRDCAKLIRLVLEQPTKLHPRFWKLIESKRYFLVVGEHEPYFKQVYDLIRNNETSKGTWSTTDEKSYTRYVTC